MLKILSYQLAYAISIVFSNILYEGICPKIWKLENITPVFKKADQSDPSNYRPITMLPSTVILFEKIVAYYMLHYLRSNNLICKEQFGFLTKK